MSTDNEKEADRFDLELYRRVVAIKCENCRGTGWSCLGRHWSFAERCTLCDGTGYERPPQQHAAIPNERKSEND